MSFLPLGLIGPAPAESTRAYAFWMHQKQKCADKIWATHRHLVEEAALQEDAQSSIGCLSCEQYGACACKCNNCGNKYCTGVCEYVY